MTSPDNDFIQRLPSFIRDERGATAIEYGLIAGAMTIVLVLVLSGFGGNIGQLYQVLLDQLAIAVAW